MDTWERSSEVDTLGQITERERVTHGHRSIRCAKTFGTHERLTRASSVLSLQNRVFLTGETKGVHYLSSSVTRLRTFHQPIRAISRTPRRPEINANLVS
jgi:hypothetical protein